MNTNVIPMFAYNDNQLRGVKIDGEPWFVARDALMCLGISSVGGTTRHLSGLDDDEKGSETFTTPGGRQKLLIISRPGLFKLIARSSKPEAKAFDRWVRHEVLPQIVDNGGYMAKDADVQGAENRHRGINPHSRTKEHSFARPGTPAAHRKKPSRPPSSS